MSFSDKSFKLWLCLVSIFTLSVLGAIFLPVGEGLRTLSAIPAVGATFAAMFQVLREDIAHERAVQMQEARNHFEIGITSHMANIAFDKHVLFCEEYAKELYSALKTLFRKGPCADVLLHVYNLAEIQRKWAVWVPASLAQRLAEFETAMVEIGANAQYLEVIPGDVESIRVMYVRFAEVYGLSQWKGQPVSTNLALSTAIETLRKVLGIQELMLLRDTYIKKASDPSKA
jgi:hypothetical protein